VPKKYQHRVLVWGIVGALIMRGIMIGVGVALVERFHFILYIFGAFLLITGIRMLFSKGEEIDLESNLMLKYARKWMRVTPDYHGQKFLVKIGDNWMLTPLALVVLCIESMDLVFAVDSIRQSSRSRAINSSSTRRTSAPSSACGRSTSCSRTSSIASFT
jgi:tellurite resistance protein TerC